jgi:hypothetical protein
MARVNSEHNTPDSSRRRFLTVAASASAVSAAALAGGVAAGAAGLTAVPASALSRPDPVFAAIEKYHGTRSAISAALAAAADNRQKMSESGILLPHVVSIGNLASGGLPRPVSTTHADIDLYTPADLYPHDNAREHAELANAIERRAALFDPLQKAVDDAYDAEMNALEELVETVPTSLDGAVAMLKFQIQYDEDGRWDFLDPAPAIRLAESITTGLLRLKAVAA